MAKLFSFILLLLVLVGCAGEAPYAVSNSIGTAGTSIVQPQPLVKVESGIVPVEPPGAEPLSHAGKNGPVQSVSDRKAAVQETKDQTKAEAAVQIPENEGEQGPVMSLLIRKDDGDEEDLAALLTPDYMGRFDIPVVFNDAVQYFIRYFTTEKRKIFANWLRRSRRYVPMIKEILRDQGLPEDLIYLAMIESGFNPKAYSAMKACGPWQFIYETGDRYGLRVNHWVDERRDPEKSTVAAALYLKDLFNQFGNWYLAAAGFNAGEKRIERAVEKHETSDFWELSRYNTLPKETREYIPRLLAAAIIAKEPERFGFTNINYDQPIKSVSERVPGGTPLSAMAKAASTDVLTVRALNPELLTGITPPDVDDYTIRLPEWIRKDRFREDLKAALEREKKVNQITPYTCKRRDSITALMKRFGITYNDLLLVNSCEQTLVAKQGAVIYIPRFHRGVETQELGPVETARVREVPRATEEPKPEKVALRKVSRTRLSRLKIATKPVAAARNDYHIVRKGESLADISEMYGIDLPTLKQINGLKKSQIYPNMRIELASHTRKIEKTSRTSSIAHPSRRGESRVGMVDRTDRSPRAFKETNRGKKKGKVRPATKGRVRSAKATPSRQG